MTNPSLFRRFLKNPRQIGALCASSPDLCREMVDALGIPKARTVIELGPGTGVITREILRIMPEECELLSIELDPQLCATLRECFAAEKVHICQGSAADLGLFLEQHGRTGAEAVVSGLPWAIFPEELQRAILRAVCEHLSPNGGFATFAYLQGVPLPAGLRFRKLLREFFGKVVRSRIVWRNLPPAFVYRCYQPKSF